MWRTQDGDRALTEAEWGLFRAGLELLRDAVEEDIQAGTDGADTGAAVFDRLTPEQKLALLADTALALRDPATPRRRHPHEGVIVGESVKTVENTNLYRSLAEGRTDVEIWDDNYSEEGWAYFSVVAFSQGTARKLAYVRVKDGRIQKRTYGEDGDARWVDAD